MSRPLLLVGCWPPRSRAGTHTEALARDAAAARSRHCTIPRRARAHGSTAGLRAAVLDILASEA
jgi:hypothetical protein